MPMTPFIPNPVQAQQYKAGNAAQADELNKSLGLNFVPDSSYVEDRQGTQYPISDGDYVGVGEDGNIRVYGKDYFESKYTQLNATAIKK
jgi:hypothetical protein